MYLPIVGFYGIGKQAKKSEIVRTDRTRLYIPEMAINTII